MHKKFLPFLCDPQTKAPLLLIVEQEVGDNVVSGWLKSSTAEYPIVNGIPRFAGYHARSHVDSFSYEWNKWSKVQFEAENIGKPMQGHTLNMWESITGIRDDLSGNVVLDLGCGPGRFSDIARRKNATVISVDLSYAVEAAAVNLANDPDICICQADALCLPIKSEVLDGVFSIGVLHHTPDPYKGLTEASRILKKNGWAAVALYGKGDYYDYANVQLWRRIFKTLWPVLGHYLPLIYSYVTVYALSVLRKLPFFGKVIERLLRVFFPYTPLADYNWSILDTFDSVTPSYQSSHTVYELFGWFRSSGFQEIEPTNWGGACVRGMKV